MQINDCDAFKKHILSNSRVVIINKKDSYLVAYRIKIILNTGMELLIGSLIALAVAIWVEGDARKYKMNSYGWALGVFLFMIVFLPLYFYNRSSAKKKMQ